METASWEKQKRAHVRRVFEQTQIYGWSSSPPQCLTLVWHSTRRLPQGLSQSPLRVFFLEFVLPVVRQWEGAEESYFLVWFLVSVRFFNHSLRIDLGGGGVTCGQVSVLTTESKWILRWNLYAKQKNVLLSSTRKASTCNTCQLVFTQTSWLPVWEFSYSYQSRCGRPSVWQRRAPPPAAPAPPDPMPTSVKKENKILS